MNTISDNTIISLTASNAELGYRAFKGQFQSAALQHGQQYHIDGLAHYGVGLTVAQYDAAILAQSIVHLPTLVPEVDAPNPEATALQSSRHKDQVAFTINVNKKVATIQEGIIAYRSKLILALNQESLAALQSTYGQTTLSMLSTNLIWTYLDNQYLKFTFATHQAVKATLSAKLLDINSLTTYVANFRKFQRLLTEQHMDSNPIQQFQDFTNTLDTCPAIAQFATEFKRDKSTSLHGLWNYFSITL